MKILHAHAGNLFGGVETLLLTLGREQGTAGVESHFALCFEGRLSTELRESGAPVHSMGEVRLSRPWTVARARRQLGALLEGGGFDVVICHSVWPQVVFGPGVRQSGVPLAFWLHNVAEARDWLHRWAARTPPDLALCSSRFTASTMDALYPHVPSQLVHYPMTLAAVELPATQRDTVREALGAAADEVVIVQVSRMEPWKGQTHLLNALGELRDVPGWVCWQVGGAQRPAEQRYEEGLKAQAEALGIGERVRFLGQREDVWELLAAADIHCQPNAEPEPFGLTFIEALAAGLPVVSFAMGGALEIVDESCGILVPPGDTSALAAALSALIHDPDRRARLAAAGPARAREMCEPPRQMARLREVLSSMRPA